MVALFKSSIKVYDMPLHRMDVLLFKFCVIYIFFRLFFRRHYPTNTVTFCDIDPQDRK